MSKPGKPTVVSVESGEEVEDRPALFSELVSVASDSQRIFTEMKDVINAHAEALAAHRYVLEKFVPKSLFEKAMQEYYVARSAEIDRQEAADAQENGDSCDA